jgi:hypothetical protein
MKMMAPPNVKLLPRRLLFHHLPSNKLRKQFLMGEICCIDPMDDVWGRHGVQFDKIGKEGALLEGIKFEKDKENEIGGLVSSDAGGRHRWALVYRWLKNIKSFFVDTSTVKLDARMRDALEKSEANNELGVGRSAYD